MDLIYKYLSSVSLENCEVFENPISRNRGIYIMRVPTDKQSNQLFDEIVTKVLKETMC